MVTPLASTRLISIVGDSVDTLTLVSGAPPPPQASRPTASRTLHVHFKKFIFLSALKRIRVYQSLFPYPAALGLAKQA